MSDRLRIVIADDESPARSFLAAALRKFEDAEVVGEARNGMEAVRMIESIKPDLALIDLQMPELDGLAVVRLLKKTKMPLVAFVTAFDEYAARAFQLNAIDYLLKPVEASRLRETLDRARERLEHQDYRREELERLSAAAADYDSAQGRKTIERIPVRRKNEIVLVAVSRIASVMASGELLHIRTFENESHTITYRLRDLEAQIDAARFIRLGRGTLVNIEAISRILPMPGGTFRVVLTNNQQFKVSRLQSRFLRGRLLRL